MTYIPYLGTFFFSRYPSVALWPVIYCIYSYCVYLYTQYRIGNEKVTPILLRVACIQNAFE